MLVPQLQEKCLMGKVAHLVFYGRMDYIQEAVEAVGRAVFLVQGLSIYV